MVGDAGEGRVPGDPSFIILSRRPHIAPTGYSIYISSMFALPTALTHIVFSPTIQVQCSQLEFVPKLLQIFFFTVLFRKYLNWFYFLIVKLYFCFTKIKINRTKTVD